MFKPFCDQPNAYYFVMYKISKHVNMLPKGYFD